MQHRGVILDINVSLKTNYFQNANNAYDIRKDRVRPDIVKSDVGSMRINTIPIGGKCGSLHTKVSPIPIKIS